MRKFESNSAVTRYFESSNGLLSFPLVGGFHVKPSDFECRCLVFLTFPV